MSQPDLQRAAIVSIEQGGQPEDSDSRIEAVEVSFAIGTLPADDLIDGAVAIVAPRYWVLEEARRQSNWGATGLSMQDVLILYSIATAAQLTAAAIIAGLMKLSAAAFAGRGVEDAQAAWTVFDEFLIRCFKIAGASMVDVKETDNSWKIVARSGSRRFEGEVAKDGRVIQARKVS